MQSGRDRPVPAARCLLSIAVDELRPRRDGNRVSGHVRGHVVPVVVLDLDGAGTDARYEADVANAGAECPGRKHSD
jgi:uncharacterized protein YcfJ